MANQQKGLMGRKVGMTQIYADDGTVYPVTVIDCSENTVLRVKTADSKDGYNAIQLGFGERKPSRTTRQMQGVFDQLNTTPKQFVREVRVTEADNHLYPVGQKLNAESLFSVGDKVDVSGTSKGCGFSGVMKRYNFRGFIRSHGTHEFFRHGGSIGTRLTPGHVLKGKKMPGHMGAQKVTVQNLEIVRIDSDEDLIFIKGGVPGPNKGIVMVRTAVK